MWISKKKWENHEKRVADLERKVQSQPQKIVDEVTSKLLQQRMTKHGETTWN